jgi:hypothetical protein
MLSCVLQIDLFTAMLWYIELQFHSQSHTGYWTKIWRKKIQSHTINWVNFRGRWSQYLLWPPCEANTDLHLLGMDRIKFCIIIAYLSLKRECSNLSVSVRVRCSNQFWLISNGRESTVDLMTVCESRFEALNTSCAHNWVS